MKSCKIELGDFESIDLHIFSDEHIGDPACNMKYLTERINLVKNNDNSFAVLGGDLIDNATKTSIGDTYSQTMPPMKQIETLTELFEPILDKILVSVRGNHELRTYRKEGIDIMKLVMSNLGLSDFYMGAAGLLFLRFGKDNLHGKKISYRIYLTHGRGGGRKEGAKAIRLADLASIVDADVYIHNHTHLPMSFKESFFRVNDRMNTVYKCDKLFVNSSANLEYEGYSEEECYKPSSIIKPVIHLNGNKKNMACTI